MKFMHKADYLILAVLVVTGLVLSAVLLIPSSQKGTFVEVRIDGDTTCRYALSENRKETIETKYGTNTFYIKENIVYMESADCHDRICVSQKGISQPGETIVCLPHKLVLAIVGETENKPAYDAVTGGAS